MTAVAWISGAVGAEVPAFDVNAPEQAVPRKCWALVRVAGAGRLVYSPMVSLEVTS